MTISRGFECPACGVVLTIDSDGIVANSSGDVIARVIDLTTAMSAARLTGGGGHGPAVKADSSQGEPGTTQDSARENASNPVVARIWAHYQSVIPGANRQTLEGKRRTIIRNALKVRSEAECIAAIDGLARSPFHNGQNDRRTKYLGIQYALKGVGAEGNDERIDKMAAMAGHTVTGILSSVPSAGREMVRTRQRQVEDMLLHPGDVNRRDRGQDSERYLRETFGIEAVVEGDGVRWRPSDTKVRPT